MNDSEIITSANSPIKVVNAWICLDEDKPLKTTCNSSSICQLLVSNDVSKCTYMLSLCSLDTVSDDKNYFSIEIENAIVNSERLVTKQYFQCLINDSGKQNSNIKVLVTFNYNQVSLSKILSLD